MTDQQTLQALEVAIAQQLAQYDKTQNLDDLYKANRLRIEYTELDVKINGGKK